MTCTDPSPWQATNNSSPRKAMSIGSLPTAMAVCRRNDGSIKLTVTAVQAGDGGEGKLSSGA